MAEDPNTRPADVVVLGAGVIGVCAAIALRRAGRDVVLLERDAPGQGTSYGNAGVISRGSITPINNPTLWAKLPGLLMGRDPGFDYRLADMARRTLWALRFLSHATPGGSKRRAAALNALIARSAALYPGLLQEAGAAERLSQKGWLKLHRRAAPPRPSFEERLLEAFDLRVEPLTPDAIAALEPALKGVFARGFWVRDTAAVDDPGETVADLARLLAQMGGRLARGEALSAAPDQTGWRVQLAGGAQIRAAQIVVALGPWSRDWLRRVGLTLPLAFERGGHREYAPGPTPLTRPIYDVDGAYVLAPMRGRWRMTCGVEFADRDAPRSARQLDGAEARLKEAVSLGGRRSNADWLGARPTLPDSLPAIGPTSRPGLHLAVGHQHIGLTTAPATGELLADLMAGRPPSIDPAPFAPTRFGL